MIYYENCILQKSSSQKAAYFFKSSNSVISDKSNPEQINLKSNKTREMLRVYTPYSVLFNVK